MKLPLGQRCAAEFIGTFVLIFIGCGAMVVDGVTGGVVTHAGVAIAWGIAVMTMIYAIGDISGAHINPAVSIAFSIAGRHSWRDTAAYIPAQLAGSLAAAGVLWVCFPVHDTLGATQLVGAAWRGGVIELVITFVLMFVILGVSTGAKEKGITAGLAIGATVAMASMATGPITNASMNPARSLGPMLLSGTLSHWWLYVAAPIGGAALAVPVYHFIRCGAATADAPACCEEPQPTTEPLASVPPAETAS